MDCIAINRKYVNIVPNIDKSASNEHYGGSFYISSTVDEIPIVEGMPLVICRPDAQDLIFESEGIISRVKDFTIIKPSQEAIEKHKLQGGPAARDLYHHNFNLQIKKSLKSTNLLTQLQYSLKSVDHFNNPIIHFQQQFRELSDKDFETIVNGWIYTARTAFGKLINSIPRQNKLEFMLQAMSRFSTIDFKLVSLNEGLKFLYEYINARILNIGRLLVSTDKLLKDKLGDIVQAENIGFRNPETGQENLISDQAIIFKKIFQLEENADFNSIVSRSVSENASLEIRFRKIFDKTTWPIDLTV